MATYVIAFYEIDRAYGGLEEGGWYYDRGELQRTFKVTKNLEHARALAQRANNLLDRLQTKLDVGSVTYKGGRFQAEVHENFAPKFYPEIRPTYE